MWNSFHTMKYDDRELSSYKQEQKSKHKKLVHYVESFFFIIIIVYVIH